MVKAHLAPGEPPVDRDSLGDAARARLAELEAGFTVEKAKVEAMKARLFARLRGHFQRRDRLRLVIGYRRKYLEALVRQGEEEAGKIAQDYRQAGAQQEQEYAETAAALAEKQELTAAEAAEVSQLWRKLVKLFHPDRCAHEPEKQETYHKLTAAINHAKDHGDLATQSASSRNCAACGRASSWKSSACWRRAMRGKSEIRISKSETNSKRMKAGNWEGVRRTPFRLFHPFGFVSDFGFRYSDFP